MGIFSSITKLAKGFITPALTAVGTSLGGPVGGAIGSALGGVISGGIGAAGEALPGYLGARQKDTVDQQRITRANAFSSNQAGIARDFASGQATTAFGRQKELMASQNAQTQIFANQQMDFQREMSGTAYQRSMADMKKAGLNPILAYAQGGAQSGSGASASGASGSASPASGPSGGSGAILPSTDRVQAGLNSAINVGQFELAKRQAAATLDQTRQSTSRDKSQQQNENRQASEQLRVTKADADLRTGYGDSVLGRQINSIVQMIKNALGDPGITSGKQGRRPGIYRFDLNPHGQTVRPGKPRKSGVSVTFP